MNPTLATDWITLPFVVTIVATFAVIMLGGAIVRALRVDVTDMQVDGDDDPFAPTDHDYDDECCLDACHRPGVDYIPAPGDGVLWACAMHAAPVRQWTGTNQPYNQEAS